MSDYTETPVNSSNKLKPLTVKYRPSLTALQILTILDLSKKSLHAAETAAQQEELFSIISYLSTFKAKIDNECITPAYVNTGRKEASNNLASLTPLDLGSAPATAPTTESAAANKEQLWEAAYAKYLNDPTSCTATELAYAGEYRYLNDLMSPEEEAIWEANN